MTDRHPDAFPMTGRYPKSSFVFPMVGSWSTFPKTMNNALSSSAGSTTPAVISASLESSA